jgi:replicative DNA helicase
MRLEQTILKHLIFDEEYTRKVLPFLKDEYFKDRNEQLIFNEINEFLAKYNTNPTYESLVIQLNEKNITEEEYKNTLEVLSEINQNKDDTSKMDWLIDKTEKFCQDQAIYNGVVESISILDGKNKTHDKGAIPDILSKALSVSFDNSIGHDYIEDYEGRYDFYHRVEEKIPFDLEYFNKITKGGLPKKSISIILAGPGTGKSLFMCHHAASCLLHGKNVLYITLEMAEERIAERIDANLLNVTVDDLETLSKEDYYKKVNKLKSKVVGKLIIKEYPTASASVVHFRNLLNELNLKKNFVPDILFLDYMNICTSSRIKVGSNVNSYTFVKSIAEEIRGLAVEFGLPIMTATQMTRSGAQNSDPNMEDVSESFGTVATADMIFALINTEELEGLSQIMVKQIKNRYSDPTKNKRFVVGIDRAKMKLYDIEASAQGDIIDSGQDSFPAYSHSPASIQSKFNGSKPSYEGFKI